MTTADEILETLDERQREAVIADPTPLKVLAGAGSGKTRVMTCRVAYQVLKGIAKPEECFVSAFTRAAANEMHERLLPLLGGPDVEVGTFHSICFRMLQQHRQNNALPRLDVCKDGERTRILRDLLGTKTREYPQALDIDVDISMVGAVISTWKNMMIHSDDEEVFVTLEEAPPTSPMWAAAKAYPLYESILMLNGKLDFDDMLLKAYDLLAEDEAALQAWSQRWTAFSIDEAQDTNLVQWGILKLLAPPLIKPNLTIVGDTRQALYRFRGAVPELMDDFETAYPKARKIDLTLNYRSTPQVIGRANSLIKSLNLPDQTGPRALGSEAIVGFFDDQIDQAVGIADFVCEARQEGHVGGNIAVLIRTNAQSAQIERSFVAAKLPYWCKNGGFFERMEIGDLVSYLRLAHGDGDEQSLRRIINKPTRYLGAAYCDAVMSMVQTAKISIRTAIPRVFATRGKNLSRRQRESAQDLASLLENICPSDPEEHCLPPHSAISRILAWTDYIDWLKRNNGSDGAADESRQENIEALMDVASGFPTIEAFLEFINESNRLQQESNDATEISTVHRAKGREWPIVIVSNFHQDSFPHKRAVEEGNGQDERRVAYVAATRARDVLVFAVPGVDVHGKPTIPSSFLYDMDLPMEESEEDLEKEWWGDVFKEMV